MDKQKIILEGRDLSKDFNGNKVLKNVSIKCYPGEGIALAGENGAGKSTLMNIISGGLRPSSGKIFINEKEIQLKDSKQGRDLGIAFVHQELSLMKEMTVGENIMLGHESKKGIFINQKKLHKDAEKILLDIGYDNINVYELVKNLTPSESQIVEIAKAWAEKPKILIFDEPTSSLNKVESEKLFSFIQKIKSDGVCVIVISHRMEDIFKSCDRVIVLKDGEFVYSSIVSETDTDKIISQMVGREFKNIYPVKNEELSKEIKLELQDICYKSCVNKVNMKIPKGSVIGVGGLEGQGQRELCRGLFGIHSFSSGKYYINGKEVNICSPTEAIKHGIAFLSDDRKQEGLFLQLSCGQNISSLSLSKNSRCGIINKKKIRREIESGIEELKVKVADERQPISSLSGGNQQKIIFSKWIKTRPDILVLHEPTRGIDVQSKLEIYDLIRSLTKLGTSVIVFTSDMLELIGISDEIYIMYEGAVSGKICGKEATEENLMQMSAGNQKEKVI